MDKTGVNLLIILSRSNKHLKTINLVQIHFLRFGINEILNLSINSPTANLLYVNQKPNW